MKRTVFLSVIIITMLSLQSFAQKSGTEFKLSLRDGSIVNGTADISSVNLTTPWGKLDIPAKNLSQIIFGITPDNGSKEKIKALVTDLNNLTVDIRKKAYETLISLPINCIPVLEDIINSSDYVASVNDDYNAELALGELKSTNNYEDNTETDDIVITDNAYRFGGTCTIKSISLKTAYGSLTVDRDKIKSIDVFYKSNDVSESSYTLLANKYISGNTTGGWLKTNIYVKAGQKISITASGEITLASLSGYKYKPDGKYATGSGTTTDYESDYTSAATTTTYPTYGNVVFKIGDAGSMLRAGASFKGTVSTSGFLYLSIYETVYNVANTGSYQVKVKLN